MSANLRTSVNHRAPALAGLPTRGLVERSDELARRWAIALILARPLEQIGEIPLEEVACEGPTLCAHVLMALDDDAELERLAAAPRVAAIAGARDALALALAVEGLRGVLWEALLDELDNAAARDRSAPGEGLHEATVRAHRYGDVCDRLAYVCATLVQAAVALEALPQARGAVMPEATVAMTSERAGAVIVDERRRERDAERLAPTGGGEGHEIAARDERGERGTGAWIGAIGRQLERFAHDGRPFAVVLLEVPAIRRLGRDGLHGQASALAARVEEVLADELAPTLTREAPGRYWLLVPDTDRAAAMELGERLTRALSRAGEAALGIAVCPQDGRDPASLAAHADVDLYAARHAARSVPLRRG